MLGHILAGWLDVNSPDVCSEAAAELDYPATPDREEGDSAADVDEGE